MFIIALTLQIKKKKLYMYDTKYFAVIVSITGDTAFRCLLMHIIHAIEIKQYVLFLGFLNKFYYTFNPY